MFSADEKAVLKWCLNRPEQTKNTSALKELANIATSQAVYKQLRPSYILKIERLVNETKRVLEEEYINPFSEDYDTTLLYNLSSGVPLPIEIADEILKVYTEGINQMKAFKKRFIKLDAGRNLLDGSDKPTDYSSNKAQTDNEEESDESSAESDQDVTDTEEAEPKQKKSKKKKDLKFHDPITRHKIKSFKTASATREVKKDNKSATVAVNRDIIGSLLSFSAKYEKPIDWDTALTYPLSPVPLSICSADGIRRKSNKSKLVETIFAQHKITREDPKQNNIPKPDSTYIVDLMAAIRSFSPIPETYEDLFNNLLATFPKKYKRVDIVADTYKQVSIKDGERDKRGSSDMIMVKSSKTRIASNFNNFLKNGENKTRMIDLMCQHIQDNSKTACNSMKCSTIYFSKENSTYKMKKNSPPSLATHLSSNQEEADTKVFYQFTKFV